MAGHSKWSNIKHKKQANDLKKSKLFSKLANDIRMSAIDSKSDVNSNFKLKKAVDKALSSNMNKSIINNIISNLEQTSQVKSIYSAIGENGVSVVIECFDSNKNRIVGELRYILNQYKLSLVSFKSIEYTYLKYYKIFFKDIYNDKFLFYFLDNFILKDVCNNSFCLSLDLSKDLLFVLKNLDLKVENCQIFYPKTIIELDNISYDKYCNMVSELKKLPYLSDIFFNF